MNTKAIINYTLVEEIMRLAASCSKADQAFVLRCRSAGLLPDDGPTLAALGGLADKAKTELRDYAMGLAQLAPLNAPLAVLTRKQEIIADIGFAVGHCWSLLNKSVCDGIIEKVQGSRGLMQLVIEWANGFDQMWESLHDDDERRHSYISEVSVFAELKMSELAASVASA